MLITKIEWTKKSNFEKMALPNGVVVNEEKSSDFAMEKTKLFELKGEAASLPRNFCWAYFSGPTGPCKAHYIHYSQKLIASINYGWGKT